MSERKVLNKYYPPDYDPSKIPRVKRKSKQNDVRIMAPFNMKCNTCGDYIANATKFNAKKETVEDETYNNLLIFRFYIKCPRCMGTIVFRTNPKNQGYEVEHGATENFMALKMAERQAQEEAEAEEEEEKINPMKHLENRTRASKQQMEASEQIQCLRSIKYRFHSVDLDAVIESKRQEGQEGATLPIEVGEDEIRAEAKKLLKRKAIESSDVTRTTVSSTTQATSNQPAAPKKLSFALSNLKKKIKVASKAQCDPGATATSKVSDKNDDNR